MNYICSDVAVPLCIDLQGPDTCIQWNLSNTDISETKIIVLISHFRGRINIKLKLVQVS